MASDAAILRQWREHPCFERVSWWLDAHAYYVQRMGELTEAGSRLAVIGGARQAQRNKILDDLTEFDEYLASHSAREESGMFAYLQTTFPEFRVDAERLAREHSQYTVHMNELRSALQSPINHTALQKVGERFAAWHATMTSHFRGEEAACVPLLLGLTEQQHADYMRQSFGHQLSASEIRATEPFPGRGRSLREAPADETTVERTVMDTSAMVQPMPLAIDEGTPTTTVRVRLLIGGSATVRANQSATVDELMKHVAWLGTQAGSSIESVPFVLHTSFPARSLADEQSSTLEEAGLLGAALTQIAVSVPPRQAANAKVSDGDHVSVAAQRERSTPSSARIGPIPTRGNGVVWGGLVAAAVMLLLALGVGLSYSPDVQGAQTSMTESGAVQ